MAIFGGDFRIGTKTHKIKATKRRGDSNFVRNVALDTNIIRGTSVGVDLSRIGGGFLKNTKNTGKNE